MRHQHSYYEIYANTSPTQRATLALSPGGGGGGRNTFTYLQTQLLSLSAAARYSWLPLATTDYLISFATQSILALRKKKDRIYLKAANRVVHMTPLAP